MDQIGPRKMERARMAENYLSCFGCAYFFRRALMVNGIVVYEYTCCSAKLMELLQVEGNLVNDDRTPDWCPER